MENTCLNKLELDTKNKIKQLKEKLAVNDTKQIEYGGMIVDLEYKKNDYESKKEANDRNKSDKELLTQKLENLKSRLNDCVNKKTTIKQQYEYDCEKSKSTHEEKNQSIERFYREMLDNAKVIISTAKDKCNDIEKRLASLDKPIADLIDNSATIVIYQKMKQDYLDIVSYNKAVQENNKKIEGEKKVDNDNLAIIEKKIFDLKNRLSDYTISKELMTKTFPTWALDKISDSLTNEINAMIDTIYDKSLNIEFEANKNSLKMTYDVGGERKLSCVKLSGAENDIVNLAIQSTFNKRQGLNCIILDEADSACSDKTAESFYNSIIELANIYNQMFVITHKQEMKNRLIQNSCNIIDL